MTDRQTESAQELRQRAEDKLREDVVLSPETFLPEETKQLFHELQVHQIELEMQNEELRSMQHDLEVSRTDYFDLYELAPVGYLTVSGQGLIQKANLSAASMFGVVRNVLLKKPFSELIFPEDQSHYHLHRRKVLNQDEKHDVEIRMMRADGSYFWAHLQAALTNNGDEWITLADVSERKLSEIKLAQVYAQTSGILQCAAEGILDLDRDGNHTFVNAAAARMLGYSPEELVGKNSHNTWHYKHVEGSPYPLSDCPLNIALREGKPVAGEDSFFRKDGSHFLAEFSSMPVFIDSKMTGMVFSFRDITSRKLIENEIRRSEEQFRAIFDLSTVGKSLTAPDGKLLKVNRAFADMVGYSIEEMQQLDFTQITHPDDVAESLECIRNLITGKQSTFRLEKRYIHKSGSVVWGDVSSTMLSDEHGAPLQLITSIVDITERKRAEEAKQLLERQFQQTQKLESLGILAGGIAHDFNNILTIIICNCSLLQQQPAMAPKLVQEIETAAQRAADLCRQMLIYAGKAQPNPTKFNVKTLVEEMVKMLTATINQNVTITLDLTADIPSIKADASQIRQVVMNLIINASEAIGTEQGNITVSLAIVGIETGQIERDYIGKVIPPGSYICLNVTDNGCGMDEGTKRRIFEPFYTTKFTGRGLGMSAVLGIITAHNGALQLTSQQGVGTTFKVYLPVQSSEPAGDILVHVSMMPWQGSGTILLVEDEPQLVMVAKALIQALGFSVIEAANGQVALELYQKHANYITLVLTDIDMPVMDGYELVRELKLLNPKLPIIVSSGFGDAEVTSRIRENIAGCVSKPYSFDQLREVLKKVVEGVQKQA